MPIVTYANTDLAVLLPEVVYILPNFFWNLSNVPEILFGEMLML